MVCLLTMLAVPGRAVNILYSDVPQDAWYMDGVEYVTKNGIMAGTGKGKFSPKEGMTRAMLVQVLYAAAGKPKAPDNPFVDVKKGSWYEESSAWAVENGIVSGYEGKKFGGNDPITRQQFVTILWRYAGSPEAKTGKYFSDRTAMADYALEAVNWARAANIISGGEGNLFAPLGNERRSRQFQTQQRMQFIQRRRAALCAIMMRFVHDQHQIGQGGKILIEGVANDLVDLLHIGVFFVELVDVVDKDTDI